MTEGISALEVKITVANDEETMTKKFLVYSAGLTLSHSDPELSDMVEQTKALFKGEANDIVIKTRFTW